MDNTPAGRQSRAAQSALQGQTTKRSERPRCAAAGRRRDQRGGNALDVCLQLYTALVKNVELSPPLFVYLSLNVVRFMSLVQLVQDASSVPIIEINMNLMYFSPYKRH